MGFTHLHCHSAYSLLEGTATPQTLTGLAGRLKMPALALTDRNNLFGVVPFYTHARKAGVKPIIGMEVDLDDGTSLVLLARNMDGYRNLCHLSTVMRLQSDPEAYPPAGYDDEDDAIPPWDPGIWGVPVFGLTGKPTPITRTGKPARLPLELLLSGRHARGLVALSGGRSGLVNTLLSEGKTRRAARAAGMLLSAFGEGNFFIELTAVDDHDTAALPRLVDLANDLGIPVVATNDVLYAAPEDAPTAEALAAARMRQGVGNRESGIGKNYELRMTNDELDASISPKPNPIPDSRFPTPCLRSEASTQRYFKTAEEMAELFSAYPQALANAHFIAEQCDVELPLHRPLFPAVDLNQGETPFSKLWKLCFAGATRLYKPLTESVISRLKYELEVIEKLGFSPYFLVVYDIAHFARSHSIPIMARGSAANSLVAYVLGITQVDPLAHDLLFERFLNPFRAEFELPDIDLDLCWRRRDEVLHYVYTHYGRDHVAIVGTHITFRLRSAWREMAKALGIPPHRISRIADRLPHLFSAADVLDDPEDIPELAEELGVRGQGSGVGVNYELRITNYELDDTTNSKIQDEGRDTQNSKLRSEAEQTAFQLCKAIEGLPRHAGMHCGGVVIAPGPITDLVPLQRAARDPSLAITQFDKDAIEEMGLVKMDLLGSRALTTLVDTLQASGLAKGASDTAQALDSIPFNDERTYAMMAEANTLGCFQLESPGMRGLLKWMCPHSMNDIAASISLFRPGPLEGGFLDIFMRRHLKQEPITYPHPSMEPILKDTYGVILYQEQFLKLVHTLAGLDLGEAEKLRKQLGKARTPEERTKLGAWFVAGAIERGIDQLQAEKVWETVAGFSGFGFCKAHACSYALTAYRSAYMKAHYPAHYLAAQINNQGGYYGPSVYVEDARRLRVELLAPHVNESNALCAVPQRTYAIRFGLQFVKGLSERAITALISERRARGPFRSLPDLVSRVEMSLAELTSLVKVGACDGLGAEAGLPFIEPVLGKMGEPIGALREHALNRKQLLWLLPALASAKGNVRRASRLDLFALEKASGHDSPGMQVLMGDFLHSAGARTASISGNPRILGSGSFQLEVPHMDDFTPLEKLRLEQEVLGFPLTRNEMELHRDLAASRGAVPSKELARHAGREVQVAGVVVAGRRHLTRDGEWMLFVTLQDAIGLIEVVLFADAYKKSGTTLANCGYGPYLITGHVQVAGKGRAIGVQPPADLRPADAVSMKMHPVLIADKVEPLLPNAMPD